MTTWTEYANEMRNAVGRVWAGKAGAEEALADVQSRQQKSLDHRMERWGRQETSLNREWNKQP